MHIARLASWTMIWTALDHGVDALPPVYYMVVRIFDSLFGPESRCTTAIGHRYGARPAADLRLRSPPQRRTPRHHCFVGGDVFFLPYYGYEARSYAIYFMLSALAFWVWACTPSSRRAALAFGAVFFAGVCFHYYFAMGLVPYVLWELLQWKPGRRPSSKLIAGIVGAVLPVLHPVVVDPVILRKIWRRLLEPPVV